ncbi:MAG: hypothetical protein RIS35_2544 [Pseudomonadota bacterium]|jgi:hypothetical protein
MLYEFKCRATGSVLMMQPVAERLLAIIGKEPAPKGIVLPAQMPDAIAALEAAIADERARAAAREAEGRPTDRHGAAGDAEDERGDEEATRQPAVTLAQRAWPMIEMLRAAYAAEREITWGV